MNRRQLVTTAAAMTALSGASAHAARPAAAGRTLAKEFVETNGVSLRVRSWGEGKPLVFLNAWGLPSDFWHYHFIELAEAGYRCVSFDRRGHGRSQETPDGYDFDTLADDVAAVINALDLRDAVMVAYSMGSCEAFRYLSRHGDKRIGKLVLLCPITPYLLLTDDNPTGVPAEYLAASRKAVAADFPKWVAEGEEAFWRGLVSPETQARAKSMMLDCSLPALAACQRAFSSTDFRPDAKKVNVPTLVLHGDRDASAPLPVTGAPTAALIPGAELKVYEGAPHGLPLTHKDRMIADLISFAA